MYAPPVVSDSPAVLDRVPRHPVEDGKHCGGPLPLSVDLAVVHVGEPGTGEEDSPAA